MKLLRILLRLLLHLSIVFSLCFLTFTVLDWYNPMMAFTANPLSAKLLTAFCLTTLLSSLGALLTGQGAAGE